MVGMSRTGSSLTPAGYSSAALPPAPAAGKATVAGGRTGRTVLLATVVSTAPGGEHLARSGVSQFAQSAVYPALGNASVIPLLTFGGLADVISPTPPPGPVSGAVFGTAVFGTAVFGDAFYVTTTPPIGAARFGTSPGPVAVVELVI